MLGAEIGIVIASVGLLLAKQKHFARGAWGIAIVLGLFSMCVAGATKINNTQALHGAEDKIHTSEHHFAALNKHPADIAEDKKIKDEIIEEFKEIKNLT